jgi:hypothetical protein
MVGKKLYHLISELSNSERQTIFIQAKRTDDKRFKLLLKLIGDKNYPIEDFSNKLNLIKNEIDSESTNGKSGNESLKIRRFVDYCIKEIENVKIKQFMQSNRKLKAYVMCEIYKDNKNKQILEGYLNDLNDELEVDFDFNDLMYKHYWIKKSIPLKLITQSEKDLKEWKRLIVLEKTTITEQYEYNMSVVHDNIVSLYFTNQSNIKLFDKEFIDIENIEWHLENTQNNLIKSVYYLILSQLYFSDNLKCKEYIGLSLLTLDKEKSRTADFIRRKIYLTNYFRGFHHGEPIQDTLIDVINTVKITEYYKSSNQRDYFLLFLTQLLANDSSFEINYLNRDHYLTNSKSNYFNYFLNAIDYFIKNKLAEAKKNTRKIDFNDNPMIGLWAIILEICICYKEEKYDVVEYLFTSAVNKLLLLKNEQFLNNSHAKALLHVAQKTKIKAPKEIIDMAKNTNNYCPMHAMLLAGI